MRIDFLCKNVIVPKYRIKKMSLKFFIVQNVLSCKRVAVQKCPIVQKCPKVQKRPSCKSVAVQKCPFMQRFWSCFCPELVNSEGNSKCILEQLKIVLVCLLQNKFINFRVVYKIHKIYQFKFLINFR